MHCYDRTTENKQFNVKLKQLEQILCVKFYLYLVTPWFILCSVINSDVVDTEDAGQVHPPGGGLLVDF